jgi:hypothetical protein
VDHDGMKKQQFTSSPIVCYDEEEMLMLVRSGSVGWQRNSSCG